MKNLVLIFGILVFLIMLSSVTKENLYYWSNEEKHLLHVDRHTLVGSIRLGTDMQALTSKSRKAIYPFPFIQ